MLLCAIEIGIMGEYPAFPGYKPYSAPYPLHQAASPLQFWIKKYTGSHKDYVLVHQIEKNLKEHEFISNWTTLRCAF